MANISHGLRKRLRDEHFCILCRVLAILLCEIYCERISLAGYGSNAGRDDLSLLFILLHRRDTASLSSANLSGRYLRLKNVQGGKEEMGSGTVDAGIEKLDASESGHSMHCLVETIVQLVIYLNYTC